MSVKCNLKELCLFLSISFIVTSLIVLGLFGNVLHSSASSSVPSVQAIIPGLYRGKIKNSLGELDCDLYIWDTQDENSYIFVENAINDILENIGADYELGDDGVLGDNGNFRYQAIHVNDPEGKKSEVRIIQRNVVVPQNTRINLNPVKYIYPNFSRGQYVPFNGDIDNDNEKITLKSQGDYSADFVYQGGGFNEGLESVLNENDLDTLLDNYSGLLESAPSNDALVDSFVEVLDEISSREDFSELEEKDINRLKTTASRVNNIASIIDVPTYSFDGISYAEIKDEDVVEIQSKFDEILEYNKRLNTVLEQKELLYELEPVLNLKGAKINDDDKVAKLVLPSKLEDETFDSGFSNISLDTPNARLVFKENTLYHIDPFDVLAQANTPDRPKQITFRAERLPQDNSFDLKVFLDDLEYKDFYGVSQKDFERDISVHLPFEYSDEDTMHLLRVEHFKDDEFINKGGMYNQEEKEMRFDTESFSIFIITTSNRSFNDIEGTSSEWSRRFVESLTARGIVDGVADGNEFKPVQNITRAETAIMIANSFRLLELGLKNPFIDVDDNDIFAPHVTSLFKHGIVRGDGSGYFNPHNEIKRQDAAIMIANTLLERHQSTLKLPSNPEIYLDRFNDKDDISDYAKRHVAFLSALNILSGNQDGNLNPIGKTTRAELSTILYKSLQLKNIQGLPYDVRYERVIDVN